MTPTLLGTLPDGLRTGVSTTANWIFLLCIIPICWSTIAHPQDHPRRAHPSAITWGMWFVIGSIATIGQALGGAPVQAWTAKLFLSLGPAVVAVVALARHEPLVVTALDRWSLLLAGLGVAIYVPLYFGWIGPADPTAAGLVVVAVAILVDTIAAGPTWYSALHRRAPLTEPLTFALALAAVLAVLAILPVPWTWLGNTLLCFLAVQMISIIVMLELGRRRHPDVLTQPPAGIPAHG